MSIAVLVAVAIPLVLLALLYAPLWLDRFRLDALPALLFCAAVGAAAGFVWLRWLDPGVVHALAGASASSPVSLVAGLVTVTVVLLIQLVAVAIVARSDRFGALVDGVVYGLATGVGAGAVIGVALAAGRSLAVAAAAAVQPLGVTAFAGSLVGLGVGYAKVRGRLGVRLAALALTVACAAGAGIALPSLYPYEVLAHARGAALLGWYEPLVWAVGVAGVAWVAWVEERRLVAGALDREAQLGVLPASVVSVAACPTRRMRAAWWPDPDERRALNRLLTTLALRGVRIGELAPEKADIYGLELGRLRERARTLLNPRAASVTTDDAV